MFKVKIFVACHKPSDVYEDDVYTPIHVGRAVSKFKEEMKDMIGDDTGDNISEKNPFFCEMTAHYWAWKNYCNSEYIGFCHYRRYFNEKITQDNIDSFFEDGTDVIVVGPCLRRYTRWEYFKTFVCSEDLAIMQKVMQKYYPEYYKTLSLSGFDYIDYPLNMLICRKKLFDQYAEWVFSILFECEKYVKPSPYTRQRRLYGYLAELLMPVYFMYNGYKMKPVKYYKTESNRIEGGLSLHHKVMRFVLRNLIYFQDKTNILQVDSSIDAGLRSDDIII